ncbi:MAG: rRNA maturation RNase YbeY, partial [Verrucomicrobia bacterium]|nr:rRNA maturation RNase YbeY [Verrucomicrobiota bacterium]
DYAPEGGGWLGGEIFVCLDVAAEQAPRYGASYPEEIVRCLSHGLLHLAGWDDQTPEQARRMEAVQERLLSELRSRFNLEKLVPGEASER